MSNEEEIIVIKGDEEENKKHRRFIAILIAILLSIALITYTGVNLIYSPSTITVGVVKPPLLWEQGGDYGTASSLGYATGWALSTNKTYFSITVKGSPELTVIIDDIFRIVNTTNVASFKVEIATAISGSLVGKIDTLTLEFWDDTRGVVGTLNLKGSEGTKTAAMTILDDYDMLKVRIIIILSSGALTTDTATVQVRFTEITPP
ncbi:MAG: hypothetical protein QXP60_05140 [Nitrososphaerota archaeon]